MSGFEQKLLQGFVDRPPITPEEAAELVRIAEYAENYRQVSKALCGKENATLEEVLQVVEQVKQNKPSKKLICQITIPTAADILREIEEVELDGKTFAEWLELVKGYKQLEQDLAAVKRERDALYCDLSYSEDACEVCKHGYNCENDCRELFGCDRCSFEWRGVCPESTEVQEDG